MAAFFLYTGGVAEVKFMGPTAEAPPFRPKFLHEDSPDEKPNLDFIRCGCRN